MRLNKNSYIRMIIFFTVEDGEALYSQQKKKTKQKTGTDCGLDHQSVPYCKIQAQIEKNRGKH